MIWLGEHKLSLRDIDDIVYKNHPVALSSKVNTKLSRSYNLITSLAQSHKPIYGINTGFGALAETKIKAHDQALMQKNIILSHAVGVGVPLNFYISKTLILLRLNTLVLGHCGASPDLINHLMILLNANCAPLVPKKGSVGASGDLAPLAHLGLLLLGLGDAMIDHQVHKAHEVLALAHLSPLVLGTRDGLALINGTQAMSAAAAFALREAELLLKLADINAAMCLLVLLGHQSPFDSRIHQLKPHQGQINTAQIINHLLKDCLFTPNANTQDPYSLRCVPQVHGASKDVYNHVVHTVVNEINAVTDNPLFFFNDDYTEVNAISGGNFHGQHLAFALDYLALAMAELGNISERRLELLLNPNYSHGLPAFLIRDSGINSGFMMLQVTAAALINENKVLCHPASIDSIPTSANREDHVSMGMTAANKVVDIINNTKTILAIELMAQHQALYFRQGIHLNPMIKNFNNILNEITPIKEHDSLWIENLHNLILWLDSFAGRKVLQKLTTI